MSICESKLPPLKGIFHLAGVLGNASIVGQDADLYHSDIGIFHLFVISY